MPRKRELNGHKILYYPANNGRNQHAINRAEWLREESRTTHRIMEGIIALTLTQAPR